METHLDFEKVIGKKAADVILDLTPKWVFGSYLDHYVDGIIGLCVVDVNSDKLVAEKWANRHATSYLDRASCIAALNIYNDVVRKSIVLSLETNRSADCPFPIFYFVPVKEPQIYLGINLMRTEKYIFYLYTVVREEEELEDIMVLLFEECYMVCRTLAPQSFFAFNMVNEVLTCCDVDYLRPADRRAAINHVEQAFCKNMFKSIRNWRSN